MFSAIEASLQDLDVGGASILHVLRCRATSPYVEAVLLPRILASRAVK